MLSLDDCPCSGNNLGKMLHPAILTVLARGPLHGYRLLESLAKFQILRGERPDPTGVYRILRSLEELGFVSGEWDLERPGPARRVYRITDEGRLCLETWLDTLRDYRQSLDELITAVTTSLEHPSIEERCDAAPGGQASSPR